MDPFYHRVSRFVLKSCDCIVVSGHKTVGTDQSQLSRPFGSPITTDDSSYVTRVSQYHDSKTDRSVFTKKRYNICVKSNHSFDLQSLSSQVVETLVGVTHSNSSFQDHSQPNDHAILYISYETFRVFLRVVPYFDE